jgi:hypothetical protein
LSYSCLEAVREKEWKLVLPAPAANEASKANAKAKAKAKAKATAKAATTPLLFNLKTDIGESTDVAAQHPEIVARLEKLVEKMKEDLGTTGFGPGCRPLGKVDNPQPLIGHDGKVRPGFEPKSNASTKEK